jgi:hypothetical protein
MADPTAPAELDLTLYQGQTYSAIFQLWSDTAQTIPFDATGCEVDIHIREGEADSGATLKIAASSRATGDGASRITWLSYASDNTVDEEGGENKADGVFKLLLAADVTSAVSPTKAPRKGSHETVEMIYDAEITHSDGSVTRVMEGVLNFNLEVTRRS